MGPKLPGLSWTGFMMIASHGNMINICRAPGECTFICSQFILSDEHHWPHKSIEESISTVCKSGGIKRKLNVTDWNWISSRSPYVHERPGTGRDSKCLSAFHGEHFLMAVSSFRLICLRELGWDSCKGPWSVTTDHIKALHKTLSSVFSKETTGNWTGLLNFGPGAGLLWKLDGNYLENFRGETRSLTHWIP